ncbi:hypothetical protein HRbin30_02074 [bacterium HR30]|nr:hypothetical protein HRbin30_02074 [bacterium HR30]
MMENAYVEEPSTKLQRRIHTTSYAMATAPEAAAARGISQR